MMRKVAKVIAFALMSAGTSGMAQDRGAKPYTTERIRKGAALYASHCESCHGVRMIGPPWASDLKTFPRDKPITLIATHAGAALKHLLVNRDSVFQRMWLMRAGRNTAPAQVTNHRFLRM